MRVNMDKIRGDVKFTGEEVNVVRAVSKIKDMNLSYMSEQQHPMVSMRHVRWQYEVSEGNFTSFPLEQAKIIEKAFQDDCPEVYIKTRKDITFKIVFKEWRQYCVTGKHGHPKTIRRLNLSKGNVILSSYFIMYFC